MRTKLLKLQKKSLVLPSAFNKKCCTSWYVFIPSEEEWKASTPSTRGQSSPSLQKEEDSFLQVHEKEESSVHSRQEKTLFLSGSGKEILTISRMKESARSRRKGGAPSLLAKQKSGPPLSLQKKVSPSPHPSTTRRESPSSYSW